MPLELPDLDDRTYADLVEEARRLIPTLDPDPERGWTDYNPSDPGITIVEMFAYLSEMLLYRLNRVTDDNQKKFLKLLQGPNPSSPPTGDLTVDKRNAVLQVRSKWRAVTAADYERIATTDFNDWLADMQAAEASGVEGALAEWWQKTGLKSIPDNTPSHVPPVARARCIPLRNLDLGTEADRTRPEPAHVSVIAVPEGSSPLAPPRVLLQALWGFLDERRILTTRHHVVGAWHAPVAVEVVIARLPDALELSPEEVKSGAPDPDHPGLYTRVVERLLGFLDPLAGGPDSKGWPFGRDIYVSEMVEQIEQVAGVDYVTDVRLTSACALNEEACAPAPQVWHAEGDLIGLGLEDHHLPKPNGASKDDQRANIRAGLFIAPHTSFVPIRAAVAVTAPGLDASWVKRRVKEVVRTFFHPKTAAPEQGDKLIFRLLTLKNAIKAIDPALVVQPVQLEVDPTRFVAGGDGGFWIVQGEVVNWQTSVVVTS